MLLPNHGKGIALDDIKKMRAKKPPGSGVFDEKQLLEMDFEK